MATFTTEVNYKEIVIMIDERLGKILGGGHRRGSVSLQALLFSILAESAVDPVIKRMVKSAQFRADSTRNWESKYMARLVAIELIRCYAYEAFIADNGD